MPTRTLSFVSLVLLVFLSAAAGPFAGSAPVAPTLTTLQPGGFRTINQTLDVNVVFIGYELGAGPRNINAAQFGRRAAGHVSAGTPLSDLLQGCARSMGLSFQFDYNMVLTDSAYEDAFLIT